MSRFMCLRSILFLVAIFAQGAWAQTLSQADCKEILSTYGVLPPQCDAVVDANSVQLASLAGDEVTPKQKEDNIFFPAGGSRLDPAAIAQIERLAVVLNSSLFADACFKLVGHSDSSGGAKANYQLSLKRAEAVQQKLLESLNGKERLQMVDAMGESDLLPNIRPDSAWQRRVEIWAKPCSSS